MCSGHTFSTTFESVLSIQDSLEDLSLGKVVLCLIWKLRSVSGVLGFAVDLHEIPKPLLNLPLSASFSSSVR